jgi:hypothetical protein
MLHSVAQKYLEEFYAGSLHEWARDEGYTYHGTGVWTYLGCPVDIESDFEDYVEFQGYDDEGDI